MHYEGGAVVVVVASVSMTHQHQHQHQDYSHNSRGLPACPSVHSSTPPRPTTRHYGTRHMCRALYLLAHTGSPKFSVTYGRVKADFVKYIWTIEVAFTLSLDIQTKLCVSFLAHMQLATYAIHLLCEALFNSHRRGTKQSLGN